MCGLVAVVSNKKSINNKKFIEATKKLIHRGPDAEGYFFDKNLAFGHKRLIVVDPSNGQQPMKYKNYILVYNGELYNTEDVKEELLKLGYTFDGHSDTEVLLKAYVEWEEKVLDKINGIFSFVVWDFANKKLFAARDRLGVKPLFYHFQEETLMVSSELKSILHYYDINTITKEGLQELLGLGPSHTEGKTVFKGVNSLRPAHFIVYQNGNINIKRYWNVESRKHYDSLDVTIEKVKELLTDAITRQLVSDVPLCTFLSGGIDSSAITAIANKTKKNIHTYSIDYENNESNFKANDFQVSSDNEYIDLLVNAENISNEKYIVNNKDLADSLEKAVMLKDTPGMADIDSSLLLFCKKIKEKHTVALSGECADEIFGGYPWFYRKNFEKNTFPWISNLEFREGLLKSYWREKLKLGDYVKLRYDETINECPTFDGDNEEEKEKREMFYLNMHWFMSTLLERKDRMSMGASLEVRVPFADHRLVEYLWNVPWEFKMLNGKEKGLLRKSLEGILPNEILYRKKNPYPKTHDPKYTLIVKELLLEALKDKKSILNVLFERKKLDELVLSGGKGISKPFFGQLMTGPQYLAYLYQLHYWAKIYNIVIED